MENKPKKFKFFKMKWVFLFYTIYVKMKRRAMNVVKKKHNKASNIKKIKIFQKYACNKNKKYKKSKRVQLYKRLLYKNIIIVVI
jgi:hypothetical protein